MGLGRITAKAESPPVNGSQINVLLGIAQVVRCASNFDTKFLRAQTFINAFLHLLFIINRLDLTVKFRSNSTRTSYWLFRLTGYSRQRNREASAVSLDPPFSSYHLLRRSTHVSLTRITNRNLRGIQGSVAEYTRRCHRSA